MKQQRTLVLSKLFDFL